MAVPIVDRQCHCRECEARTSGTYQIRESCSNCGSEWVAMYRKGDKANGAQCPVCEVISYIGIHHGTIAEAEAMLAEDQGAATPDALLPLYEPAAFWNETPGWSVDDEPWALTPQAEAYTGMTAGYIVRHSTPGASRRTSVLYIPLSELNAIHSLLGRAVERHKENGADA